MKILVTGGSGFIGTVLVQELIKQGHEVTIYDKQKSKKFPDFVHLGDIRNVSNLTEAMKDKHVVYHLAAEHADDVLPKTLYFDVNVGGAKNIVKAATSEGVKKIIFTSSVAIYGLNVGIPTEENSAKPFNDYGKSKWESERVFNEWAEIEGNSLQVVRPAVVFGEGNRGNVYNLFRQIYSKRFLMIGDGLNQKSMGYVGNIAVFLSELISAQARNAIYNYADKPDLSTGELVKITRKNFNLTPDYKIYIPYKFGIILGYIFDFVAWATKLNFPISSIRVKKFCANTVIDTSKLEAFGFKQPFTMEQALSRTIGSENWGE